MKPELILLIITGFVMIFFTVGSTFDKRDYVQYRNGFTCGIATMFFVIAIFVYFYVQSNKML